MADVLISCINKQPRDNPHEGITHLGGPGGGGWKLTRQAVVTAIESGTDTFYTQVNGRRANVGVINGPHSKYVQTHADGQWNNNLLALPECR